MTRPPIEDYLTRAEACARGDKRDRDCHGPGECGDVLGCMDGGGCMRALPWPDPEAITLARYALALESELATLREVAQAYLDAEAAVSASDCDAQRAAVLALPGAEERLRAALARRTAP